MIKRIVPPTNIKNFPFDDSMPLFIAEYIPLPSSKQKKIFFSSLRTFFRFDTDLSIGAEYTNKNS